MALFCQFVHPLDTMFAKENANIREKKSVCLTNKSDSITFVEINQVTR